MSSGKNGLFGRFANYVKDLNSRKRLYKRPWVWILVLLLISACYSSFEGSNQTSHTNQET